MDMPTAPLVESTVNHLFRHQSGKMVAVLTRIFGARNLHLAEDVVQETLLSALEQWKIKGIPADPNAWLFIVAKNKALNLIKKNRSQILFGENESQVLFQSGYTVETTFKQLADEELVKDDQLRMMYACCHPEISVESQVTLILKTLCGFSTSEIAKAFLTSEETISKRLYRTKEFFRTQQVSMNLPSEEELTSRTASVLQAIYLLFNEGYNSTHSEDLIRKDLIDEAILLCKLLIDNEKTRFPEVYALLALMHFHAARSETRISLEGEIVLLPQQNRSKWNKALIKTGIDYLNSASTGSYISTYHLEAAIAYEHCAAKDFEHTDWMKILDYYELLNKISPSAISELNKAVCILFLHGPEEALAALEMIKSNETLKSFYLLDSLLGEVYARLQQIELAIGHFQKSIEKTKSASEKKMLQKKIEALLLSKQ